MNLPGPRHRLSDAEVERTMRRSITDGVLFALMLGVGETCFLAEAVRIGAGPLAIGLLTSLPLLCGGLGSLLVLRLLRLVPRRRPLVVGCALGQVAVLGALAAAIVAGVDTGPSGLAAVLTLLCLYHTFGQAAGTAWSSWYGDVVPRAVRGRYFAHRTRVVQAATFVSILGGGFVLEVLDVTTAFATLFALAGLARLGSALLLSTSAEPEFRGLADGARPLQFLVAGRGRNAWRLLLCGGLFHVGVYIGAPFFVPYLLAECGLDYSGYMITLGAVVLAKAVTLPIWGRLVDRWGSHRTFRLALFLSAWVPLPFLWSDELLGLSLAYAWSGVAWGGYEVAAFAIVLDSSTRRTRPQVFAAQGLVNGSAQLGGSMAGAWAMQNGYGAVFTLSFVGRMAVALLLPWFVRGLPARRSDRGRGLALRLVGFRPAGGLVHRPVFDESGSPPTPRLPAPATPTPDRAAGADAAGGAGGDDSAPSG